MRLISKTILPHASIASATQTAHVLDCLPPEMKRALLFAPDQMRNHLEEIRLRIGQEMTVTIDGQNAFWRGTAGFIRWMI